MNWFWNLFLVVGILSMLSTWWLLDITIAPSFGRLFFVFVFVKAIEYSFLLACKMWSVPYILELILCFSNIDSWRLFSLRVPNTPPRVLSKYATFLNFDLFLFVLEKIFSFISSYCVLLYCLTSVSLLFPSACFSRCHRCTISSEETS